MDNSTIDNPNSKDYEEAGYDEKGVFIFLKSYIYLSSIASKPITIYWIRTGS